MEQVKDRSVEFSNRFRLVNVADGSTLGIFDLDEITGEIYEVGTPLDAKLFDGINADILKCVAKIKLDGTNLILKDKDGNELDTVDLSTLTFDVELKNYYTKTQTDALIASEKERAETAEKSNEQDITDAVIALADEVDRAKTAENSLAENITAGIAEAKDYTDDETRRAQMAEKVNSDLIAATAKELADEITRAKLVEGDIIADTDTELNKCVTEITLDETQYKLNLKNKNDADIGSVDLMPLASSTGSVSILYTETPELYQIVTISYAQWAEISRTPAKAVHINDNVYASNGYIYNVYNNNYIANDTNNIQLRCTYVPVNHGEVTAAVNTEKERAQTVENSLSDRITTAQDTADEAESIARGRAQARVFDTKSDMDEWIADETHTALLNVGDNLYIKDTGVPDYWWNGEGVSPLEAEKPDLTEYYTKTQTDGKIYTAKTEANAYTDTQIAEETAAREVLGEELTAGLQTANTQINQNSANIDSIYEEISELDTKKYQKPDSGIPKSDLSSDVIASLNNADEALTTANTAQETADSKYTKPSGGIPNTDLAETYVKLSDLDRLLLELEYPVGGKKPYIQYPGMQPPAERWAGTTWEIDTAYQGRMIIGSGGDYELGDTGGNDTHSHEAGGLISELAMGATSARFTLKSAAEYSTTYLVSFAPGGSGENNILSRTNGIAVRGQTGTAENLPPYIVVNCWKRTA